MDCAELPVNCLCSAALARSCATCWCPDNELADGACEYRRMAGVMIQLDAARDELLDHDDGLVGCVKDVKEVGKRILATPEQRLAFDPVFLALSCPHQRTKCTNGEWYVAVCTSMYWYVL
jgi:hypothetical protein